MTTNKRNQDRTGQFWRDTNVLRSARCCGDGSECSHRCITFFVKRLSQ